MYIYRKGVSLRKSENNTIFNRLKSYQNSEYFFPDFRKTQKDNIKKNVSSKLLKIKSWRPWNPPNSEIKVQHVKWLFAVYLLKIWNKITCNVRQLNLVKRTFNPYLWYFVQKWFILLIWFQDYDLHVKCVGWFKR